MYIANICFPGDILSASEILLFLVHCGSIRQTATILSMDKDCLRTGDKATVHFRFIKTPEYLHIDQRLVFREGRTKAVGTITKVIVDGEEFQRSAVA